MITGWEHALATTGGARCGHDAGRVLRGWCSGGGRPDGSTQRRTRRTERKRRQTALSVCGSEKAGRCVKRNM